MLKLKNIFHFSKHLKILFLLKKQFWSLHFKASPYGSPDYEWSQAKREKTFLPTYIITYMVHVGVIFTRAVKVLNEEKCHLPLWIHKVSSLWCLQPFLWQQISHSMRKLQQGTLKSVIKKSGPSLQFRFIQPGPLVLAFPLKSRYLIVDMIYINIISIWLFKDKKQYSKDIFITLI